MCPVTTTALSISHNYGTNRQMQLKSDCLCYTEVDIVQRFRQTKTKTKTN